MKRYLVEAELYLPLKPYDLSATYDTLDEVLEHVASLRETECAFVCVTDTDNNQCLFYKDNFASEPEVDMFDDDGNVVIPPDFVFDERGYPVPFEAACELMDDDIRELVSEACSPCSKQMFFDEYNEMHKRRYGHAFCPVI